MLVVLGCGPLALGRETDGATGVGSGEAVLVLPASGPLMLGGGITDGAVDVGSGELVSVMAGSGVISRAVEVAGAAVGPGMEDGSRVLPCSSSVDRYSPTQLHSCHESEMPWSLIPFASHSDWSTVGGSYTSSTHGSVPVSTIAATHGLTSYPDASDAAR